MGPMTAAQAAAVLNVGLRAMSERVLTFGGMLICAGLFGWVMYSPDPWRLAAAAAFAVLVYLPVLRHEAAKAKQEGVEQ